MPAQPNDLAQARTEAALLLRLDPENLSPSDTLRCDLIASLRLVVDDSSATVLDGRGPDLSRLIVATETLIRLLPQTTSEPVDRREGGPNDPRQHMWRTYLEMRKRGELADPMSTYEGRGRRIAELEARIAELEAALVAPGAPTAPVGAVVPVVGDNVVPLSRPANERICERSQNSPNPPAARPFVNGTSDLVARYSVPEEPWREYANAHYDPWADNRE